MSNTNTTTTRTAIVPGKPANDPQVALEVLRSIATGGEHVTAALVTGLELTENHIAAGIARGHVATTNADQIRSTR